MPKIIASTYEIMREIGSGGGGIVYLARHMRLGKWVVLKADRRTLSTRPEVLRREVDALKNLSHTYIPQVYDFVQEDGVVYTVMDYIEGESLDKPLSRGERFSQATVIEWGCQLLEAISYLHSRPPNGILHADIKPANVMLTPQGDIRLIDFNIALALGETGAVRVGFSRGYASPEHYGVDCAAVSATQGVEDAATQLSVTGPETVLTDGARYSSSGRIGKRTIYLDVRSDIYSLGATLYHLLTGQRPPQDAREVKPIPCAAWSPAVSAIIQKAMAPNPNDRFQTAAEMLDAFEHLHENDPRTKRHKRRSAAVVCVLTAVFLMGGALTFVGLKQMERTQNAYALAEYSADALRAGDVEGAVAQVLEALPEERGIFDPPYTPQAQRALSNALGIYDLTDGFQAHLSITLSASPIKVALSPEGTRMAALTDGQVSVFDTEHGGLLAELPANSSALSDIVFTDENTVLYAGANALCAYDLSADRELWTGEAATSICVSADGSTAATVYRDESRAVVYDLAAGTVRKTVDFHGKRQSVVYNDSFADPEDDLFALNGDGTRLAVSFRDGGLCIFDLRDSGNDLEIFDHSEFTHFEGGFFEQYFALSATADGQSVFAVIDTDTKTQTGGFAAEMPFHVRADVSGIYLTAENLLVKLDPVTGEQTELAYTGDDITSFAMGGGYTLVATAAPACAFFDAEARLLETHTDQGRCDFVQLSGAYAVTASRDVPTLRVMKLEKHREAQLFTYDAAFLHDEARISADGSTVMLFRYDAFRLLSMEGEFLAEVTLPNAERVYDQQYRRDETGSYLEVIYYSGLRQAWSAVDGTLLWEKNGDVPDATLEETFTTDHLRIISPLHGTPTAYDLETGQLIGELESDDYLTYVTQVGNHVVTEYISAQGTRYGLLLDAHCDVLAELPNLCDILADGTLIFDDMRGNLRQGRIYSTQELIALGKIYQGGI